MLFFGMLKDYTGVSQEHKDFPDNATLGGIFDDYADRCPGMRGLKAHVRPARNHAFSEFGETVAAGDEVAFLPPVSGGSPDIHVALTRQPIDSRQLTSFVQTSGDGAVVTFEGVVRDNTKGRATLFLDYEGYEPMALQTMGEIGLEIRERFPIKRIALVHRLGRLNIGEASVAIVTGATHRKPAFDAALQAIDEIKRRVPIWKKEHFVGGEVWVEGEWEASSSRL